MLSGGGYYQHEEDRAHYLLTDHLGNVRMTFAENSQHNGLDVLNTTDYDPYGAELPGRNFVAQESNFGYQGQEKLELADLYSFELRNYDTKTGLWTTPDPYMQHPSPYTAMSNNPVNNIDPDGGWDSNTIHIYRQISGMSYELLFNQFSVLENFTKYVDEEGNEIGNTEDGKDRTVIISGMELLNFNKEYSDAIEKGTVNDPLLNDSWLFKFGRLRGPYELFIEKEDDAFIDCELNLKVGIGFSEKAQLFGIGQEVTANPLVIDLLSFTWDSNKGRKTIPYKSISSSFSIGSTIGYGGTKKDWSNGKLTPSFQYGNLAFEKGKDPRFILVDAGFLYGVGFDFKISLSAKKFINSNLEYNVTFNDRLNFPIQSFTH